MLLKESFEKDIYRPIDPVVKANETQHLANELDEFVVTNEVKEHLLRFFDEYNDPDAVGNGAWISGFFGSGKSHLLKILAVALEDREVAGKRAMDYLVPKVSDTPALAAGMEQAVRRHPSESILFNIDSFAPNAGRSDAGALLSAFIKAFNHHCGYFDGDQQHIAKLEYDLDREGKLDAFRQAVESRAHKPWEQVRKSALLYKRQITAAFDEALGNPEGTTLDAVGYYKDTYQPDIRSFAQLVAEYIESKGQPGFRLNFFVDEVGQFIAQNTNLMVNLQTIAEELDYTCGGNSWVVVTSQEDMENVVGQMKAISANDFSKIQARFHVKMTLTSSDAKEVIRDRLLAKKSEDEVVFEGLYERYRNDFGVLFDFADGAKEYKCYQSADEFCGIYPFVPYQFEVFMSAMRGLSDHNCFTGRHNSTGARSMLGVFQMVAERICDEGASTEQGTLAAFDMMFEGLRNDLKSEVYAAISTAEDQLDDEYAVRLLKALLLVKYVDDFRATPGNLRVLLYGAFSQSTFDLNQKVTTALDELERQVYVRRNGNVYEYLTNDEKEVEQEISNTAVPPSEQRELIAQLFHDVCGASRVTYKRGAFDHVYSYNLRIDGEAQGRQPNDLTLDIVTAYEPTGLVADMVPTAPKTLSVSLRGAREFLLGVRSFKQTERYANAKSGSSDVRQAIILDKQVANGKLYERLRDEMRDLLTNALFNAGGVDVTDKVGGSGRDAVESALIELVRRSYTGLQQITAKYTDNDVYSQCLNAQGQLIGGLEEYCETVLARARMVPGTVTVGGDGTGSLTAWFTKNEYGWPEVAVRSAVAKLYAANKVEVRKAGALLEGATLADALKRKRDLDKLTVSVIEEVSAEDLARLQKAFRDFAGTNPKELDPKAIAAELAKVACDFAREMRGKAVSANAYPFAGQFSEELGQVERCADNAQDRSWVTSQFPEKAPELAAAKKDLSAMASFCEGSPMAKRWAELKGFLVEEAPRLGELDINPDEAAGIRSVVNDHDCYKSGRIPAAYQEMTSLRKLMGEKVEALRERALSDLEAYRTSYEQTYDLGQASEGARDEFYRIFEQGERDLKDLSAPHRIRGFVETFKEANAARLVVLAKPAAPEPAGEPEQAGTQPEGGDATAGSGVPAPAEDEARIEQPKPKPAVSVRKLKARGFSKPVIETEEDAESYLGALKQSIMDELADGKTVTV